MIVAAVCSLPFAAWAQNDTASAPASAPAASPAAAPVAGQGLGAQTRFWLATQTSGVYSVTEERPMSGEAASLVYQRYLNSFTHPIPERYESDSFSTNSSGSGGGSMSSP
jgi:hypothetical protein